MKYGDSLFNGSDLQFYVELAVSKLLLLNVKAFNFIYRGNSGSIFAGALMYALKINGIFSSGIYVRKEHEQSHGSSIAVSELFNTQYLVFVDDLIDSGETLVKCLEKLPEIRCNQLRFNSNFNKNLCNRNLVIVVGRHFLYTTIGNFLKNIRKKYNFDNIILITLDDNKVETY